MIPRFEAEELVRALAGGAFPSHGDVLIFDQEAGWRFGTDFVEGIIVGEEGDDESVEVTPEGISGYTTLAEYGITDAYTKVESDARFAPISHTHPFTEITGNLAYSQLPTGGGTWANGGALTLTGGDLFIPSADLVVGHTSNVTMLGATPDLSVVGTSSAIFGFGRWSNNALGGSMILAKSRGATVGAAGAVQVNDLLGNLSWGGDDGTSIIGAARIRAEVDGTVSTGEVPARIGFLTVAAGGSITEKMRLTSDGHLGLLSGARFYLDSLATGDTYITESSANVLDIYVGGANVVKLTATNMTLSPGAGAVYVHNSTSHIATTDFMVAKSGASRSDLVTAHNSASATWRLQRARGALGTETSPTTDDALGSIQWRGYYNSGYEVGGSIQVFAIDDFSTGVFGSRLRFSAVAVGGTGTSSAMELRSDSLALPALSRVYLDGIAAIGDTYLTESSANVLDLYAGGVRSASFTTAGGTFGPGAFSFPGTVSVAGGVAGTTAGLDVSTQLRVALTVMPSLAGVASSWGALLGTAVGIARFTSNAAAGASLGMGKALSNIQGTYTQLTSGTHVGSFIWYGADGTDMATEVGRVRCEVLNTATGTAGANRMPGILLLQVGLGVSDDDIATRFRVHPTGVAVGGVTPITTGTVMALEVAASSGSATIVPVTVRIRSTRNAGDWDTATTWGNLDFYSDDGNISGGIAARIGVRMTNAAGSNTALVFNTMGTDRWRMSSGFWLAETDNAYDIGIEADGRPRTIYVGTDFVAPATGKVRLDGLAAGNTYITESAADTISLIAGGATTVKLDASHVYFGTHSALAAETVTGYITIKDAGGTLRKLAVVS